MPTVNFKPHPACPGVFIQTDMDPAEVTVFMAKHYGRLLGRKIVRIDYEKSDSGPTPVLVLDNGMVAGIMCDPEGNGPGHLQVCDEKGRPL